MAERVLFLTGKLAHASLERVLESMHPTPFLYKVVRLGISVAGLMTADFIRRHLADAGGADRIVVPGRCRGDLAALSAHYGVPVERGPDELKDLPAHFGRRGRAPDLSRHDVTLFAEIVDAPTLDVAGILARAARYREDGADVIDLGCLPDTPFGHLEEAVAELKRVGHRVSVDSLDPADLVRGAQAGAEFLLSLTEETLPVIDRVDATPVLIPAQPGDLDSLGRAIEAMEARGRPYYADAILEPIHFGFTASVARYRTLRERYPKAPILVGVGNLTELTDADTMGVNALLFGIVSELEATAVLATEVSPHARSAVREAAFARRMMFAAREARDLPRGYSEDMLGLHSRRPFPDTPEEIAALAAQVKDPSFRIQTSQAGVHVYNRDGMRVVQDPFDAWPGLGLEDDAAHAFYMGVELARAEIAWRLGKRYAQDEPLDWGVALPPRRIDLLAQTLPGSTVSHALRRGKR
jgi:dihydropteroate synthase-like protein